MQRTAFIASVLACGLSAGSCTSRTLPLPPPEVTRVTSPDADGIVTVTGYALEGASVGVLNERTMEGVLTASESEACDSTCPWTARLHGEVGDPLRVWQFVETESARDVVVPKPR
ncbi:MAG TPA: hypothetical protein VJR89_11640 [Polyangiales bacterium]|nr:hypothetical protein [Polyangiales bacterium]